MREPFEKVRLKEQSYFYGFAAEFFPLHWTAGLEDFLEQPTGSLVDLFFELQMCSWHHECMHLTLCCPSSRSCAVLRCDNARRDKFSLCCGCCCEKVLAGPSGDYWLIASNLFSGILLLFCSHQAIPQKKKGMVDQLCCLFCEVCSVVSVWCTLLIVCVSSGLLQLSTHLGQCSLQTCIVWNLCRNVSVWLESLILSWVRLGFHSWHAYVPFKAGLSLRSKLYNRKWAEVPGIVCDFEFSFCCYSNKPVKLFSYSTARWGEEPLSCCFHMPTSPCTESEVKSSIPWSNFELLHQITSLQCWTSSGFKR